MRFEIGICTFILVIFVTSSCYGQTGQYIPGYEWIGQVNCSLVVTPASLPYSYGSTSNLGNGGRKICVMRIQNWLPTGVFNLGNNIAKCSFICSSRDSCRCVLEIQPTCSLIYQNVKYTDGQHPLIKSQQTPICQLNKFSLLPSTKNYKYYCSLKANAKAHYQENFNTNSKFFTVMDSTYSCTLMKVPKGTSVSPSSTSLVNIQAQDRMISGCSSGWWYCWPNYNFLPSFTANAVSNVLQVQNPNCYDYNSYSNTYSAMCTVSNNSVPTIRIDNLAGLVFLSQQVAANLQQQLINYNYYYNGYSITSFYFDYDITMELNTIESFTQYQYGGPNPGISTDWVGQVYTTQSPFYQSTNW